MGERTAKATAVGAALLGLLVLVVDGGARRPSGNGGHVATRAVPEHGAGQLRHADIAVAYVVGIVTGIIFRVLPLQASLAFRPRCSHWLRELFAGVCVVMAGSGHRHRLYTRSGTATGTSTLRRCSTRKGGLPEGGSGEDPAFSCDSPVQLGPGALRMAGRPGARRSGSARGRLDVRAQPPARAAVRGDH